MPIPGKQYVEVTRPVSPTDPKKITVEEFFSYACSHCNAFEPKVQSWLKHKPADVDFVRVPDALGRTTWENFSRAYYVAQILGVVDKIHEPMFTAIWVEGRQLNDMAAIRSFFAQTAGVKPEDFDATASSFTVDGKLRAAEVLQRDYEIEGTPTFVVGGRYKIATMDESMTTLDFVIDKVRRERGL